MHTCLRDRVRGWWTSERATAGLVEPKRDPCCSCHCQAWVTEHVEEVSRHLGKSNSFFLATASWCLYLYCILVVILLVTKCHLIIPWVKIFREKKNKENFKKKHRNGNRLLRENLREMEPIVGARERMIANVTLLIEVFFLYDFLHCFDWSWYECTVWKPEQDVTRRLFKLPFIFLCFFFNSYYVQLWGSFVCHFSQTFSR